MPRATGAVMGDRVSSMGLQRQIFFWLLVLVGFIAFLLVFSSIFCPSSPAWRSPIFSILWPIAWSGSV